VLNKRGQLVGIVTDGDLRRHLLANEKGLDSPAREAMTRRPKAISPEQLATEALKVMQEYQIGEMPVVKEGKPVGMLNLKDLLKAGIV